MRRWLLSTAVVVAVLTGCSEQGPPDDGAVRRERVNVTYPISRSDFTVRGAADADAADLRRLAEDLVTVPGVAVTEADYDQGLVRVVAEESLDETGFRRLHTNVEGRPDVTEVVRQSS